MTTWLLELWRDLRQTWFEWNEDDGSLLAAAVSYYAALSLFPLLLTLISGLGIFLEASQWGEDARKQVLDAIGELGSPVLESQVADAMSELSTDAALNGPLGLAVLLLTAVSIFAQLERAFGRVWNVEDQQRRGMIVALKRALYERGRAFLMLLCVGLLILTVFTSGLVLTAVRQRAQLWMPASTEILWGLVQTISSMVLNAVAFALLYRFLPRAPVRWREALWGGLLVAVVWEIGRQLLAAYLMGSRYTNAYGVVGSFLAVMVWIYFASTVLLMGGEYVQVVGRRRRLLDAADSHPE